MRMYCDLMFIAMVVMFVLQRTVAIQRRNTADANMSQAVSTGVTLKLLIVLPLHTQPYQRTMSGDEASEGVEKLSTLLPRWDRGLEILPAAYVATEQINGLPNLFPGLRVDVVAVNSSLCNSPVRSESSTLVVFMKAVANMRQDGECLLGVAGVYCEAVTLLLSYHLASFQPLTSIRFCISDIPVARWEYLPTFVSDGCVYKKHTVMPHMR